MFFFTTSFFLQPLCSSKEVAALTALREEVARQTILVQSLAATASKRHVTEVLVHMLEGKCRRNAYYCEKLHQVNITPVQEKRLLL